ncbi:MAG: hypothetical protein HWQ38_18760 [Nostoc sp. NMS7]|uniref:hypothetical protein n=1 Tax=Nostoc sp. NMS7 TaxID=2815391 RepID=UPI0025E26D87|nr:hypothetical protein [Nostoc sp. NMS7]MBN3948377.1 hypothetical protein [Nostoc sp. NMS7]
MSANSPLLLLLRQLHQRCFGGKYHDAHRKILHFPPHEVLGNKQDKQLAMLTVGVAAALHSTEAMVVISVMTATQNYQHLNLIQGMQNGCTTR